MKHIKFTNKILAGLALAFFFLLTPHSTDAQGRYANVYSRTQVKGYIDRLERSSNTFRRDFDSYMDRSNLNGTATEDQYNEYVRNYVESVDRLQRDYSGYNTWWENRANVQSMLTDAQPVNDMINQLPFARNIERQWRAMRDDINKVADTFDLPGLNGGGWNGGGGNGGGWNGGGQTSTPPSWAQGTFSWIGTDPRQMTIDRNDRVTLNSLGTVAYGSFYRNVITINGERLNVTRSGNGIRLFNPRDNGTSDWTRGTTGGGGWDGGGQTSAPPTWAQGTFTWQGTDPRRMMIDRNGRVTLTALGATSYGTYYRDVITINGERLNVSRYGSEGIRLYNPRDNGTSEWRGVNNNPGYEDGGGNTSTPPSWARGTFTWVGTDPRQMTIERNGRVRITALGATTYGSYYRDVITINGESLNVSRIANGIRLYNPSDNGTSEWLRR